MCIYVDGWEAFDGTNARLADKVGVRAERRLNAHSLNHSRTHSLSHQHIYSIMYTRTRTHECTNAPPTETMPVCSKCNGITAQSPAINARMHVLHTRCQRRENLRTHGQDNTLPQCKHNVLKKPMGWAHLCTLGASGGCARSFFYVSVSLSTGLSPVQRWH